MPPRPSEEQRIGNLIRILRLNAGLSQTQLGQSIGVTFQQIQKYESGTNRVATSSLAILAQVLGVSPSYFFEEHKKPAEEETFALLSDKRAQRMLKAYTKIESVKLKDTLLRLAESLATEQNPSREHQGSKRL